MNDVGPGVELRWGECRDHAPRGGVGGWMCCTPNNAAKRRVQETWLASVSHGTVRGTMTNKVLGRYSRYLVASIGTTLILSRWPRACRTSGEGGALSAAPFRGDG